LIAGLVGVVLLPTPTARATNFFWINPGGGNWNVANNWDPAVLAPPPPFDNAIIQMSGAYTVTLSDDRGITDLTLRSSTATLSHTSGTLSLGGTIAIDSGTYSLNGGTISGGTISPGDMPALSGGLQLQNNNANVLNNVTIQPSVLKFVAPGARVRLQGTTTLAPGTVVDLTGGISVLAFEQTTTTNGLTVNLSTSGGAYLSVEGNNTLTLGPTSTVTCNFASNGAIAGALYFAGTPVVVNQGLIRTTGSSTLNITVDTFTNSAGGIVRAESGSLYVSSVHLTNYTGTTLTGGTWEVLGNASLIFGSRPIATLAADTTVVFNGANPSFPALDALTTNNGTLRVLGGKTFTPTAASVNNAGVLEVGAGSTFSKGIVVQNGGTLRGSGAVSGAVSVQNGGTLEAGSAAPGVLTANSGVTLVGGATFRLALNGATPGQGADNHGQLVVNGAVDLGGATLNPTLGYSPSAGDVLVIVDNDGIDAVTGLFKDPQGNTLIEGATFAVSGSNFRISYLGGSGNDVVLSYQPVPEPGSMLLVGAAGSGVFVVVRRLRRTVASMPG
jgi:hypothetical protein